MEILCEILPAVSTYARKSKCSGFVEPDIEVLTFLLLCRGGWLRVKEFESVVNVFCCEGGCSSLRDEVSC